MPKVPKVSFWRKRKKLITIVGVILLIVAAVGIGILVRWVQQGGPSNSPSDDTVIEGANRLPDVVSEVQDLNSQGKTEEANQLAQESLQDASTSDEVTYMLYIQQGNGKYNDGDVKGAIEFYQKALAEKETTEITQLLGAAYADTGDKAKAIEYYKKALNLVPASSPTVDAQKESLEQMIISLGGQP